MSVADAQAAWRDWLKSERRLADHTLIAYEHDVATFLGAPFCPADRHAIRAMGTKVCFLGVPWDQGQIVRAGT